MPHILLGVCVFVLVKGLNYFYFISYVLYYTLIAASRAPSSMMPPRATLIILTPHLHLFSVTSFIKSETRSTNLARSTYDRNFSKRMEEIPLEVKITFPM